MAFLPFNFNPVLTLSFADEGFSYTVPAGFYAIVSYSLHASASWHGTHVSAQSSNVSNGHNSQAGTIYISTGSVLTRTLSVPTGTSTASSAVTVASSQLNVDANPVAYVSARASFDQFATGAQTFTISNEATAHATISVYAIP